MRRLKRKNEVGLGSSPGPSIGVSKYDPDTHLVLVRWSKQDGKEFKVAIDKKQVKDFVSLLRENGYKILGLTDWNWMSGSRSSPRDTNRLDTPEWD